VPLSGLPASGSWTLTRNPGAVTSTGSGTTTTVSGLAAGTYSFTVTNAQGCTSSASVNVIVNAQPSAPAAPSATVTQQPTCSVATGTVTITSTTTGLQFSVDGGAYASYPVGGYQLASGSHNIRARGASDNTCISPQTGVTVNSQPPTPAQPTATVTQQPNCTIATGTITVTSPAPGTGITYSVDGTTYTNTSGVFTGLVPATYSVTVKNSDGCISTPRSLTVNPVPASSLSASATTVDIICGVNTGTIIVTAAGGVPPYTYSLNGAAATIINIFSGLGAGTYTIKITDAIGCTKEITAVIDILNSTLTATASVTNVACGGTTGSAVISASGGTPPYNYSLDGGSFGTASGFPNLTAGAHSVKVKDALNCTFDVSVNILAAPIPPAPTATATQPTCLAATGTISITTPAPASGISYSINGTDYSNTSGVFPGLAPGNYNVTYKNSAGCTSAALNVIINSQPPTPAQPIASVSQQPDCSIITGTITVTQPSPATGISYSIDGANYTNNTGVFTGIAPGNYNVTVKNSSGCVSPALALTVNAVPAPPGAPTVTVTTQPSCSVATGNVTITSSITGLEFSIDNGAFATYPASGYDLSPGTHNIRARRTSDNCISLAAGITIQDIPNAPASPIISVSQQPTCSVTTGTVIITSSTANLEFSVDGGTYAVYPNGGYQLSPGNHTITARSITDINCISTAANVTVNSSPGIPSAPTLSITQPTCSVATGTVTITSATTGLQFSLDGGTYEAYPAGGYPLATGSHTLIAKRISDDCTSSLTTININSQPSSPSPPVASVSEQPGCTVSTGTIVVTQPAPATGISYAVDGTNYTNTTGVFTGLVPGTYPVTVKNAQGCTSSAFNVTVNTAPAVPAQPTASVSQQPNCTIATGTITVTQPAPAAGTSYSIDGTDYTNTTGVFTGLVPATYSVTVKNAGGCISAPRSLTVNNVPNSTLSASANAINIICGVNTGTITVIATGGIAPYTYSLNGAAAVNINIFTLLPAGSYQITVKDALGCTKDVNATIELLNSTLTATASVTNIACGTTGGSAVISASGGLAPYSYSLDGGTFSGTSGFTNLGAGQHNIKVKDALSCTYDVSVTILPAPVLGPPTVTITQPTCDLGTGSITITQPAPATGITYSIDGTDYTNSTGVFTSLVPAAYSVTVKNAAGCISSALSVTVNAAPPIPSQPVASVSEQPNCAVATGTITVTQPAPATGISYSIDGANYTNITGVFSGLLPGNYNVTVKNAGGCISPITTLTVNAGPTSSLFATATIVHITCGQGNGSITINVAGGTAPFTYSLNGATAVSNNVFTDLSAGSYKVTVKDASGCSVEVSAAIQQTGVSPNLVITNPPALCAGSTTNLKAPSITNGSEAGLAYTYWKDVTATTALPDAEATAAGAGTYYIKGTSQSGCFVIKPVIVTVSNISAGTITPATPAEVCNGETLVLKASAGVSYQWYKNDVIISGATNATYNVTEAGTYNVSINNNTCTGKTSTPVVVTFKDCPSDIEIFVPTAFTPNNNFANDNLQPYFLNVRELNYFKVYNRWGQLVFETNTIGKGWDGNIKGVKQPTETYTWILECTDNRGEKFKKSGKSLLIR
jgi:gliding motility-associated-like protein